MTKEQWQDIVELFNSIKYLYSICEETDPDLCTNLQPLNEFRAALDHMMRIVAIENLDGYEDKSADDEARKLISHLRRAFFDVCDMLSINYRNRIIDILEKYDSETIAAVIPNYYTEIKPDISDISETIASLRTDKRVKSGDADVYDQYTEIVKKLKKYQDIVIRAESSLVEIQAQNNKKKKRDIVVSWVIPIAGIVIGGIIGAVGWFI